MNRQELIQATGLDGNKLGPYESVTLTVIDENQDDWNAYCNGDYDVNPLVKEAMRQSDENLNPFTLGDMFKRFCAVENGV